MHFKRKRITLAVKENSTVALTAGLAGATPATTKTTSLLSLYRPSAAYAGHKTQRALRLGARRERLLIHTQSSFSQKA